MTVEEFHKTFDRKRVVAMQLISAEREFFVKRGYLASPHPEGVNFALLRRGVIVKFYTPSGGETNATAFPISYHTSRAAAHAAMLKWTRTFGVRSVYISEHRNPFGKLVLGPERCSNIQPCSLSCAKQYAKTGKHLEIQ